MKRYLKIITILIGGVLGAFLFQLFIFPILIDQPFIKYLPIFKNLLPKEIVINPKQEIIIKENTALTKAIEKVEKTVVGIQSIKKKEGCGIIVSSDGLIITLAELKPQTIFVENEKIDFEIVNQNLAQNLISLKVKKTGLQTVKFADWEKLKLGERVFLIGIVFEKGAQGVLGPSKVTVNEGIIKGFDSGLIKTNIFEKNTLKGSALFNLDAELIGINTIGLDGEVITIPIAKLREFLKF